MAARKTAAKKSAAKKAPAKKTPAKKAAKKMAARRADYGTPAEEFVQKLPPAQRTLVEKLRKIVEKDVKGADFVMKWGMPFFMIGDKRICSLGVFKQHIGLVLFAPAEVLDDPDGVLEGGSNSARTLKVRSDGDIQPARISKWLKAVLASASI